MPVVCDRLYGSLLVDPVVRDVSTRLHLVSSSPSLASAIPRLLYLFLPRCEEDGAERKWTSPRETRNGLIRAETGSGRTTPWHNRCAAAR